MKEKTLLRETLKTDIHKLRLLSIGDELKVGDYRVHSKFRRVVNFVKENCIVSVVTEEVGGGPVNIVIENSTVNNVETLSIKKSSLYINGREFSIDKNIIYNSSIDFSHEFSKKNYTENLYILRDLLIFYSPRRSLSFLLSEEREKLFETGFERVFMERIKDGVKKLFNGEIENGVNLLKGVGFGLTPSGDDFISGVLAGLYILENLFNYNHLALIRERIYALSKTDNLISSNFLYFSNRGEFFERVKNLITSIIYKGRRELEEHFFKLMGVGDTSGSDIGTGLFMTLKKGGEVWL